MNNIRTNVMYNFKGLVTYYGEGGGGVQSGRVCVGQVKFYPPKKKRGGGGGQTKLKPC